MGLLVHWSMDKLKHDYIFKCIFLNETDVLITDWLRCVFNIPIENTCESAFVQATAGQRTGIYPFSEPMITYFTGAYICKMYNCKVKLKMRKEVIEVCVCPDYWLRLDKEPIMRRSRCRFVIIMCKVWNYRQSKQVSLYRLQQVNDPEFPPVTVTFRYILATMWDVNHNHTLDLTCCSKHSSYFQTLEAVSSLSTIGLILVRSNVSLKLPEIVIWISYTMETIQNYVRNT